MALSDEEQDQADALRAVLGGWDGDDRSLLDLLTAADGDLYRAAAAGWRVKAAGAADLVDVSEGSSRRTLSQLRGAYTAQAAVYDALADATAGESTNARSTAVPVARRDVWGGGS